MEKGKMTAKEALQIMEKVSGQIKEGKLTPDMVKEFKSAKEFLDNILEGVAKKDEKNNILSYMQFTLSMPRVGSWNGRWTGEEKLYAKAYPIKGIIGVERAEEILELKSFNYNFGDGWMMNIKATKINSADAKIVNKKSAGFMGYEWAIKSIIHTLEITTDFASRF